MYLNIIYNIIQAKLWKNYVPQVSIKLAYINEPGPKGKREKSDSGEIAGRAVWPKKFKKDKVELLDFQTHLQQLSTGEAQKNVLLKGVGV